MSLLSILFYTLIPTSAAALGALAPRVYTIKQSSLVQHLVAGIVIGAVALDLIPKIEASPSSMIGFVCGAALMLGLRFFSKRVTRKARLGVFIAAALDLLIDGFLIGLSFIAGVSSGILIALSLSLCAFFLTYTLSVDLKKSKSSPAIRALFLSVLSLMLLIGAALGGFFGQLLSPLLFKELIAFGVAALLYLGTEELLAEAHSEAPDRLVTQGAFFLGFLLIFLVKF